MRVCTRWHADSRDVYKYDPPDDNKPIYVHYRTHKRYHWNAEKRKWVVSAA
jgi:hypothetical protein